MKNIILKYGLISGIIFTTVMMVSIINTDPNNLDTNYGQIIGYSAMSIAFLLLIPAVNKANTVKPLNFWRALLVGLQIVLVACVLYSLVWTLYVFAIDPEGANAMGEQYLKSMEASGKSAKDIADMRETMNTVYGNPLLCFLFTIIEPTMPGIAFSLIAAAINHFRNKKNAEA